MTPRVLLGITGSIAAYKSCEIISQLVKDGVEVKVIMTESAKNFISPLTIETLSRNPLHTEQFLSHETPTEHIALARWADVVCVAPASADTICKYAAGIADNLLITELLAYTGTVLMAPAMNHKMYTSFQVQNAIALLKQHGVGFVDPWHGELACGEVGIGKMAPPEQIVSRIMQTLRAQPTTATASLLQGKRLLITAGPTRSYIDPVRFISNPASGKMGFALAEAAAQMGAKVTLITGPCDSSLHFPQMIRVETAAQMRCAVFEQLRDGVDIFMGAAAVNDFGLEQPHAQKIKKDGKRLTLTLQPEEDIIAAVATAKQRPQLVVGFAAETEQLLNNGRAKLLQKNLDYIVINDVSKPNQGFAAEDNAALILSRFGEQHELPRMPKRDLALQILEVIHASYQKYRRAVQTQLQP